MKRIIAWALCLLIAGGAALAETYAVSIYGTDEREGCAILIAEDGSLLTPLDTYASIYELTPKDTPEEQRRFCVQSLELDVDLNGASLEDLDMDDYYRVALMDSKGKLLTGFDYLSLSWANGGIRFDVPGRGVSSTGVMDIDGHVVVEPEYNAVQPLGGGRWLALKPEPGTNNGRWQVLIVDEDGGATDTGLHTWIDYLTEGDGEFCPVYHVAEYQDHSVYLNREGEVCFGRSFDSADTFFNSCAAVEIDGQYGLINREGELVVEPAYPYLYHTGEAPWDVFISDSDGELVVFDAGTGAELMRKKFENVEFISAVPMGPGLLWVYCGNRCECYRTDGTLVGSFPDGEDRSVQYSQCTSEVVRFIETVNPWPDCQTHLIDEQGHPIGGDYRGIMDGRIFDGHPMYTCYTFRIAKDREGDATADWRSWRYGVLNENGEEVLKTEYLNEIQILSPDRFWVTTADRTGMIDASGKWYYTISSFDSLMD